MTQRPIPAFYCVYLLRSTVRPASLYIGSTPNPRRRLSQHNEKGGANRTSRVSLRPWEMVCIVTGFPSNIAALQFEWAWQHPHRSLKIPTSFLQEWGYTRKESLGRRTLNQKIANLHLLAQVDAFSRWPLSIRFFAQDVFLLWEACCATQPGTLRRMIQVILDVRKKEDAETQEGEEDDDEIPPSSQRAKKKKTLKPTKHAATGNGGLQGLDLTYRRLDPYFQKVRTLLVPDHDLTCNICQGKLEENHSFTAVCPHAFCEHVTHLKCLAQKFLDQEETPQDSGGVQAQMTKILPTGGNCPGCRKWTEWGDVVREISVRTRTTAKDSAKEDEEDEEDLGISAADMADVLPGMEGEVSEWGDDADMESVVSDAGSDTGSVRGGGGGRGRGRGGGGGKGKGKEPAKRKVGRPKKRLSTVAEDSDWDNVETIL